MNNGNGLLTDNLHIEFKFAKFAEIKGKSDRAVAGYEKILNFQPDHEPTFRALGELLLKLKSFKAAAELFQQALTIYPNNEVFHKNLVTALIEENGLDAPFVHYQLSRIDFNELNLKPTDILACIVVRNEALRLPFFLEYYRQKGVDKFFFVDNISSDGTAEYLQQQPDVFLWQTPFSFKQSNFGSAWFEVLLRKYGIGHWVLTVDADEIFYYPNAENKDIPQLCAELEAEKKRAYQAILLDMYADKPLRETQYIAGQNFFEVCPFFDRKFYHRAFEEASPYKNQTFYFGGMRERVFGKDGDYLLSKIPLLKYDADVILAGGQHFTNLSADEISEEQGCLLHFKYFDFFADYVQKEVRRNEHACNSMQYHQYHQTLEHTSDLFFYNSRHSVRFRDSRQLIELGVMRVEEEPKIVKIIFPQISPVTTNIERPFWSIKITAYRRVKFLKKVLESVLRATANCEKAEIEVINDAAEPEIQAQIKAIVEETGQGRVKFYSPAQNLGHPDIFNFCINRANGHWIHLLHDDDLVHPDFYNALEAGIKNEPEIGAAFCRFSYIDESGTERLTSNLERQTAGIIENWLELIATNCRVQFPAIVINRAAYEKLGGFCAEAKSAFDWEMWKRLAASFPVWFEPKKLAYFREHSDALSHNLIKSGQQIADSRKTIAISNSYFPVEQRKFLSRRALRELGLFAVSQAKRQIEIGDRPSAQANLREALICSQTLAVIKAAENLAEKYNLDFIFTN
jgi:glycosyltransferase involved in cell wall biosynthesis